MPAPDLRAFPYHRVAEGSEFFSLRKGVGRLALTLSGAVVGLMRAQALLIYAITEPANTTDFFAPSGFSRMGEAIVWPYAEGLSGEQVKVQPMLITGASLDRYVHTGFDALVDAAEGRTDTLRVDPKTLTRLR
ncbi:MAG: hypothetical protein ACLQAT_13835 [Candidatus Binataceae bacterium]